MLVLSNRIYKIPILSLRDGLKIGEALEPIINPDNLHIDGFYCSNPRAANPLVLLVDEIRDFAPQGFIINELDDLAEPEDLVRLQPVMDIGFELLDKPVETESGRKLGKVVDFATNKNTFFIDKLYVERSTWLGFNTNKLLINRSQVTEVNDHKVIVRDAVVRAGKKLGILHSLAPKPATTEAQPVRVSSNRTAPTRN